MIAAWMLYAALVAALIGLAAAAGEPLARTLGAPARRVWGAALVLALLWPSVAPLRALTAPSDTGPAHTMLPVIIGVQRAGLLAARAIGPVRLAALDAALLAAWGVATTCLLLRMMATVGRLERRRAGWRRQHVDGLLVRISPDAGPAVVGLRRMEIVLPEWTLALDQPLRAMVLRHEAEHLAARDPHALLAASLAVALLPWNLPLWWHARRLRLAIELDCDARVLRAQPRPESYGRLLLAVAQRRGASRTLVSALTLTEPASHLERRIIAMHPTAYQHPRLRLLALAAAAAAATAVACTVGSPTNATGRAAPAPPRADGRVADSTSSGQAARMPSRSDSQVTARSGRGAAVGAPAPAGAMYEFQLRSPAERLPGGQEAEYPAALRAAGTEGEVLTQFVVNKDGSVDAATFKVLKSTAPEFTAAVRTAVLGWRFRAATVDGGRAVRQLVQRPFIFKLGR